MAYTTSELIAAVKSIASIPSSQNLFTTTEFLRFANHELQINLVPMIMSAREEYFVAQTDLAITAGQAAYDIPVRAVGGKLRDVQRIEGSDIYSLPRLEPELITSIDSGRDGFYLEANTIVLTPTPTDTQHSLRLKHFRRPNTLVAETECAKIESVDVASNQVTCVTVPSTFGTGTLVDFIKAKPGFECKTIDAEILGVSGTTITFASLPSGLAAGDYLAIAGESPIPQIPVELHPVLFQAVAVRCLIAQGKKAEVELRDLQEMKRAALLLLTPRIDGEPRKIVSPYSLVNHFKRGF